MIQVKFWCQSDLSSSTEVTVTVLWGGGENKQKKENNSSRSESHLRRLSVNPTWHPRTSLAAPACQPLPCQGSWDLTMIHPTPEAEEDTGAAALCLWPFRDGESSILKDHISVSGCLWFCSAGLRRRFFFCCWLLKMAEFSDVLVPLRD